MAVWLRMHLAGGARGVRLLGEDRIQEMQAPQTVIRLTKEQRELFPEVNFAAYGLAWSLRDYRGRKLVGHGGAIDGMRAEVMLVPEEGWEWWSSPTSEAPPFPRPLSTGCWTSTWVQGRRTGARSSWSGRQEPGGGREARARREAERVEGTRPSLPVERYAGIYADSLYGDLRVEVEGGG
jgi:hypothetical protein